MDIPFKGTYQREDIYQAVRLTARESLLWKIFRMVLLLIMIVNIVLTINQVVSAGRPAVELLSVIPSVLIAAYIILQPVITAYLITSRIWKQASEHANVQGNIKRTGLTISQFGTDQELEWQRFTRAEVSDRYIVLLAPGGYMNVFPRSFFVSDSDWNDFIQLIQENVLPQKPRVEPSQPSNE